MQDTETITDQIIRLLNNSGSESYCGEAVSQLEHALQAAALAQQTGKDEEFIVACLLHDIGHLSDDAQEVFDLEESDETAGNLEERKRNEALDHGDEGARFLEGVASDRMRWLIAGHATAKRYLCAVEPGYYDQLSPVSKQTLEFQGGPMTPAEVAELETHPWLEDLILLRRFDDEAKAPDLDVPALETYRPMLERQLAQLAESQ
ncbi:HD domain-containing protein [soil metagenome]